MRNWLTLSALRLGILLAPVAPFLQAGTNPATITVIASPSPWTNQAQPLSVQVTVSGSLGTPTGSIKLYIDNGGVGGLIPLSGGSASFTIPDATYNIPSPNLQPGSHTIGVAYTGDSNYLAQAASSNNTTITISGATLVNLSVPNTQPVLGQPLTITATVSIGATGVVDFIDNGSQVLATLPVIGNQAVWPGVDRKSVV